MEKIEETLSVSTVLTTVAMTTFSDGSASVEPVSPSWVPGPGWVFLFEKKLRDRTVRMYNRRRDETTK